MRLFVYVYSSSAFFELFFYGKLPQILFFCTIFEFCPVNSLHCKMIHSLYLSFFRYPLWVINMYSYSTSTIPMYTHIYDNLIINLDLFSKIITGDL